MSTARRVEEPELTPRALAERAARTIMEGIEQLVEAKLAAGAAASEWIDQSHSPLGRRRHLELARAGKLPSRKDGRKVLVRREDLNRYLDAHAIARGRREEDEDVDDVIAAIEKGGRRR